MADSFGHSHEIHIYDAAVDQPVDTPTSKARQGLDELLAQLPQMEVLRVNFQPDGPWTEVDLGFAHREHGTLRRHVWRYAIWNLTGNVYTVAVNGPVADDPFITITPFTEGGANE